MSQLTIIIIASWLAGITAFVGGVIAWIEGSAETTTKREIVHGVITFGGGILLAAIAFALLPQGISLLSLVVLTITFCAGGLLFLPYRRISGETTALDATTRDCPGFCRSAARQEDDRVKKNRSPTRHCIVTARGAALLPIAPCVFPLFGAIAEFPCGK